LTFRGDEPEHVQLARCELTDRGGELQRPSGRSGGERFNEAPGDRGCQQGVSGGDHTHRVRELRGLAVFEQKSARTGPEYVKHIFIEIDGS
jgi:hypothetical protein